MILFWIIYILGYIATVALLYFNLDKGTKVPVAAIVFAFAIGFFSWLSFIIALIFLYGDCVVFTKK